MSLEEDRARGDRALALMNDPVLAEAFAGVDAFMMKQAIEHTDDRERERFRQLYLLGRKYRDALRAFLTDGKIAADQIAKAEQKAERGS